MMSFARWDRVTKRYGAKLALDELTLELAPGEALALLGANGAGKTTAVHLLLGLIAPDSGVVTIAGQNPQMDACRAQMGAVLQVAALPEKLSVAEVLAQHANYYPTCYSITEALELAHASKLRGQRCVGLSGGERRRVEFALAIIGKPKLLILDEPTTGVDVPNRRALLETIGEFKRQGTALVLTTHILAEAEALVDRVAVLRAGRIVLNDQLGVLRETTMQSTYLAGITELPEAMLLKLPGVQSVRKLRGKTQLSSTNPDACLRAWMAADQALHAIEVQANSLEDRIESLLREEKSDEN
jgi:ABC-2 type transport system ATP-binding protein